ncbi:MAG: hypothetical protein AWT59_2361 [Candidatus Gallionella acididurans]|uniref:Uncharacterized protein n=1 Tax=Candidatus Gallionella acididurans TaxID=1796491 RepID=A0A139BR97_9PROT|nr:MAG: hypothetical protein AWT59_2361 [Candidatus Gallionella acididurans]
MVPQQDYIGLVSLAAINECLQRVGKLLPTRFFGFLVSAFHPLCAAE